MTTPILGMAEIVESQASKHLTHNAANRILEATMFGVVKSRTTAAEPATFADGDIYILPASPTGASWAGFSVSDIVVASGGGWHRITPTPAMRLHKYVEDNDAWTLWDGAAWLAAGAPGTGTGNGGTVDPPTAPFRYVRWTMTEAPAHTLGYQLGVVQALQLYATSGGPDVALTATATASSTQGGYSDGSGVNDDNATTNWANGAALPATVVFDFGGAPVAGLHSYAVTSAEGGNAAYPPNGWTVEIGNDPGAMVEVDARTGQAFAVGGTRQLYTVVNPV